MTYIGILLLTERIVVEFPGREIFYLYQSRGRVVSACFLFNLTPDDLRSSVSHLRRMGRGIERWIVPGLEFCSFGTALQKQNPEAYAIIPELIRSCRDLPVADYWKRVRENWRQAAKNVGRRGAADAPDSSPAPSLAPCAALPSARCARSRA